MANFGGDSPDANRRRMLKRWLAHSEASKKLQQAKGRRVGRAPGSMKRYEDGSVGSTDRGIRGPGKSFWPTTPRITNKSRKRWI